MTPKQIVLVQESFDLLPTADVAARFFYDRLFELDPSLRQMFHGDMQEQGRKLMTMIRVAVANLNRLDEVVPAVEALGERHARYGVQDSHYETVGTALIWTLEQALGDTFTPETRQAWIEVYGTLTSVMQSAAHRSLVPA